MRDFITEIEGKKVELQGNKNGVQIYKVLDNSVLYIIKDGEIIFDLFPVVTPNDMKAAVLVEYDID